LLKRRKEVSSALHTDKEFHAGSNYFEKDYDFDSFSENTLFENRARQSQIGMV
jgi:hypothetical protein